MNAYVVPHNKLIIYLQDSDSSTPPTPNHLSPPASSGNHSTSRLTVGVPSHARSKSLQDFELSSHYRRQDATPDEYNVHLDHPMHRTTSPQPISPTSQFINQSTLGVSVKKRSNAAELRNDMIKRVSTTSSAVSVNPNGKPPPLLSTKSHGGLYEQKSTRLMKMSNVAASLAGSNPSLAIFPTNQQHHHQPRSHLFQNTPTPYSSSSSSSSSHPPRIMHQRSHSAVYEGKDDSSFFGYPRPKVDRKQVNI